MFTLFIYCVNMYCVDFSVILGGVGSGAATWWKRLAFDGKAISNFSWDVPNYPSCFLSMEIPLHLGIIQHALSPLCNVQKPHIFWKLREAIIRKMIASLMTPTIHWPPDHQHLKNYFFLQILLLRNSLSKIWSRSDNVLIVEMAADCHHHHHQVPSWQSKEFITRPSQRREELSRFILILILITMITILITIIAFKIIILVHYFWFSSTLSLIVTMKIITNIFTHVTSKDIITALGAPWDQGGRRSACLWVQSHI